MKTLSTHLVSILNNVKVWWNPADFLVITPQDTWKLQYAYAGFTALCLVLAIALVFIHLHPNLKSRINSLLWTNIFLGPFLYVFRVQGLPILGMDMWRFVQEVATVIWAVFIFIYWKKQHPKVVLKERVDSYKSKYLPKAKK